MHQGLKRTAVTIPLAVALTAAATAATPAQAATPGAQVFAGPLSDLQTTAPGPFDGANARLVAISDGDTETFNLIVTGIDRTAAGTTYGAHVHVGPCVEGNGAAAGPHYNVTAEDGQPPTEISNRTEVWLDFTVNPGGVGVSSTTVPFVVPADARSVVIHQEPTAPNGTAGARQACLPVNIA